jgi:hypothetical protein
VLEYLENEANEKIKENKYRATKYIKKVTTATDH